MLRKLLAGREKTAPQAWRRFFAQSLPGRSLAGQRRFADAEPLIVDGSEGMRGEAGSMPAYFRSFLTGAAQRVVDLYVAWGKPAQAEEWRKKLHPARR